MTFTCSQNNMTGFEHLHLEKKGEVPVIEGVNSHYHNLQNYQETKIDLIHVQTLATVST